MTETCPICGEKLSQWVDYLDGHILCESSDKCPEGHYWYYYAYGYSTVNIFDKEFTWSYLTPEKEVIGIQLQIGNEIDSQKLNLPIKETK